MSLNPKKIKKTAVAPRTTGLLDIISPLALDFAPKFIINGDLHQDVLTIIDYPEAVNSAWLARIVSLPGVVSSIHMSPTDADDLIQDINISMGELEGKLVNGASPLLVQRTESRLKGAKHLIQKIDAEQQKVFFVTITLLISAFDYDTLQERTKRIKSILAGSGMRGRTPIFRLKEGLSTVGPYGLLSPEIASYGARNMPVETIAAMYPFVYSGLNDGTGVLVGSDTSGGIVLLDLWKREGTRTNSNITVLGRPGVGKSTAIKKLMMSEWSRGTRIIVIDPEREYKDLCENLGGDWIDCGGGTKGIINPLQIRSVPEDDDDEDDEDRLIPKTDKTGKKNGALGIHFQFLRTWSKLYLTDLNSIQMTLLEIAYEKVYEAYGITWDTDPRTVPDGKWPIIEDVYNFVTEESTIDNLDQADYRAISYSLRSAAIGADKDLWNGQTTVKTDSKFINLDINQLLESDEKIQKAQFYNVLSFAWGIVAEDRTEQIILASDETYLIVDPEVPQPLRFLRNTSKRIRKYGGGLWVITHNMIDFMDPAVKRYGQALMDNPAYKIIMGQGENDIEALEKLMKLSEKEVETLESNTRGEALLIAGDKRIHAKFEMSPFELEMFGTAGGR